MSNEEVKKFKTSCESCIFAINRSGRQQVDCELGRLSKFIKQDRANLDEFGYYRINGICNTCRGETWKNAKKGLDLVATVEREIQIKVDFLVYSIDASSDLLIKYIEKAINSSAKQEKIQPKSIVVVVKNNYANYKNIYYCIQDVLEPYEIPFQLVRITDEGATVDECIEMGMAKCRSQYVAMFDSEYSIPSNVIKNINDILNYKIRQFILAGPIRDYHGLIIANQAFTMFGKNQGGTIYNKVYAAAKEQERQDFILGWDELWNQK